MNPSTRKTNPFVAKAGDVAEAGEGLSTPSISARSATCLHDLGQMRVQFNFRTYLVEPVYRDDNLFLWDLGDSQPQRKTIRR